MATADQALAQAQRCLELLEIRASPVILRLSHRSIIRAGEYVLRIDPERPQLLARELLIAQALDGAGVPVVRPAHPELLIEEGLIASVWHYEPAADEPVTAAELGHLLRRFHQVPLPEGMELPRWGGLERMEQRLADLRGRLSAEIWSLLEAELVSLRAERALEPTTTLGIGLLHGDAYPGNILNSQPPRLADLEQVMVGPREWDLVPLAAQTELFGRPVEDQDACAAAYGYDVRGWELWPSALRQRALSTTLWRLATAQDDEEWQEGLRRCLWWQDRPSAPVWRVS